LIELKTLALLDAVREAFLAHLALVGFFSIGLSPVGENRSGGV
jgi:hypothetical protein